MRCLLGWISDWSFITSVSCNKLSIHAVSAWGQLQRLCDQLCSVWRVNIVCPPTSVISILWMYLNCPTVIRRIFFLTAYFHHLTMLPLSIAHCRIINQFWIVIKQGTWAVRRRKAEKATFIKRIVEKNHLPDSGHSCFTEVRVRPWLRLKVTAHTEKLWKADCCNTVEKLISFWQ